MTRAEIRIAAAKKRARAAEAALSKAYERKRAAVAAASDRTNPAIWKATRKFQEARQAVAVAELAALGIVPMKTIILWHPKGYTAPSAQNRYVVRVTLEGWTRLVPVGKNCRTLKGRVDQDGPYSKQWDRVTVTDQELQE